MFLIRPGEYPVEVTGVTVRKDRPSTFDELVFRTEGGIVIVQTAEWLVPDEARPGEPVVPLPVEAVRKRPQFQKLRAQLRLAGIVCALQDHFDRPVVVEAPAKRGRKRKGRTCACHGRTFARATTLRRHLNPPQRTWACAIPGCTRSFSSKYHLKMHAITHATGKPVACTVRECPQRFKTTGNMRRHIAVVHEKLKKPRQRRQRPVRPRPLDDEFDGPAERLAKRQRLLADIAKLEEIERREALARDEDM